MKKKLLTALLSVCCLCVAAFGIAGCDSKHEHTYSDEWSTDATQHWHAATCEHTDEVSDKAAHDTNGTDGACSVCGYNATPTEPTEHTHSWSEWTVETKPTATATGKATRTCANDGCNAETADKEYTLPVLASSDYTKSADTATCTAAGSVTYSYNKDGVKVSFIVATQATGHRWGEWTITAPTEEETGTATRSCTVCSKSETVALPLLTSDAYTKSKDTATCMAEGSITYTYSTADGISISFEVATPIAAHQFTHVEAKDATATEDGNIEYWVCNVCGFYFSDISNPEALVETTSAKVVIEALGTKIDSFSESVAKTYQGLSEPDEYGEKYSYTLTLNTDGTATFEESNFEVYQYAAIYGSAYKYKINVSLSKDGWTANYVLKFNVNSDGTITLYDTNYNLKAVLKEGGVQALAFGEIGSLTITAGSGGTFDTYQVESSEGGEYIFATTSWGPANGQSLGAVAISVKDKNDNVTTFSSYDFSNLTYVDSATFLVEWKITLSAGVNYVTVGMMAGGLTSAAKEAEVVFLSANTIEKTMTVVPGVPYDLATELSLSNATYRPTVEGYVTITDAGVLTADEASFGKSLTVYAAGSDVTYILSLTINYNEYTVTVKDGASAKIDPEGEDKTLQLLIEHEDGTTVVWSIDNSEEIDATISEDGLLTAGEKTGVATVRATVKNSAGYALGYATIQINISSVTDANVFTWNITGDSSVELTGYNSSYDGTVPTSITIPETIWYDGTTAYSSQPSDNENAKQYTVTAIALATKYSLGAFYNKTTLTEIIIPSTVTSIGDYAFYKCTALASVTLGSGVTSIGASAFYQCSALEKITIPASVTSIGASAFASCSKLATLYLENLNAWYGVTIGSNGAPLFVKGGSVYAQTPSGYTLLTSLEIPANVTEIGANAFYKWTGITKVTFLGDVTEIGDNAFNGCTGLTAITLPASVTSIGQFAFNGCSNLKKLYLEDLEAWYGVTIGMSGAPFSAAAGSVYVNGAELTSLYIPGTVTKIGAYQFYNWAGLTEVTFLGNVTSIGDYAFYGCSGLTAITLPASVSSIGKYAFYGCKGLTEITIPEKVTTISDYAFQSCIKLASVTLGSGVTSIGANAFYQCSALKKITIPASVTSIGANAFYKCTALTEITIPDGVTKIGNSAFYQCTKLATLTIGSGVISIGDKAFYGCTALTQLYYNATACNDCTATLNSTPFYQAGYKTSGLTVTIGANVTKIPAYLFYNGQYSDTNHIYITSLVWAENSQCTTIGKYAFCYFGTQFTSLTIPESVTTIGEGAFKGNWYVTELYYNATNCTTVSSQAFAVIGDNKGTTVTIGANVTALPANLFYEASYAHKIIAVVFEGTSVASIGNNAFASCTSSGNADGTSYITSVYYKGTAEQWSALTSSENFGTGNTPLTSATVYYYSEEQPATEGNYWRYDSDGKVTVWTVGS